MKSPRSDRYVVVDENTLCVLHDDDQTMSILRASILRGSRYDARDGWTFIPDDRARMRPATTRDFREFRESVPCGFREPGVLWLRRPAYPVRVQVCQPSSTITTPLKEPPDQ